MKLFGEYLRRLFISFSTLITGGVIGLYYVFVYPYIETWQYRFVLDIAIPVVAFLVAGFLAWRGQYLDNIALKQQIADLKDDLPKYKLKVIDESKKLDEVLEKIASSRTKAEVKMATAPVANSWMAMSIISRTLHKDDWKEYIEKLDKYRDYIEEIKSIDNYRMVNFELTNVGKADKNLNVTLHFENAELIPEFYEKQVENKRPDKPSADFIYGNIVPNFGPISKLGSRREIHKEEKDLLSVEYDVMRGGDVFHLHYDPMFIKSINDEPMRVKYSFKSDKLIKTTEKTLTIK